MGFETAKRGLTAAQKGLDVAGQNLTNWDSAGYTRQRITQVAIAPDSYRPRYSVSRVGLAGQGVEITGIDQTRDVFLDKRFREESGDLGYYGQAYTVLADIQASINEFNPNNDVGTAFLPAEPEQGAPGLCWQCLLRNSCKYRHDGVQKSDPDHAPDQQQAEGCP